MLRRKLKFSKNKKRFWTRLNFIASFFEKRANKQGAYLSLIIFTISICLTSNFLNLYKANAVTMNFPENNLTPEQQQKIKTQVAKLSLPFIESQGQIDSQVKYYANAFFGSFFITNTDLTYLLVKREKQASGNSESLSTLNSLKLLSSPDQTENAQAYALKEVFLDQDNNVVKLNPIGVEKAETKVNYFLNNDQSQWKSDLSTYNLVSLGEIYPNIEVKAKAYQNNIEKIFYLNPGANPADLKIQIQGAKSLKINDTGELEIETEIGTITQTKPYAYQEINGEKKEVDAIYTQQDDNYGFSITGDYDQSLPVVIDPLFEVLNNSTYIGGSQSDNVPPFGGGFYEDAKNIVIDSVGNIYITGSTESSDFPTTVGAFDTVYGGSSSVIVSKFNSDLSSLLASTFLGGAMENVGVALTIDSSDNIYLTGYTRASDFPVTPGTYDATYNDVWSTDVFVSKFNSNLDTLIGSTYLGSSDFDFSYDLDIDSMGNVYVVGTVASGYSNFPTTPGAYDTTIGGNGDAFISKFDSNLTSLLASTYFGKDGSDEIKTIIIDSLDNVNVAGWTDSSDFPTTAGVYDEGYNGSRDVFISRFDSGLSSLLASTYLGGGDEDRCHDMAFDSSANIYITGYTGSSDYPTTGGAFDTSHNGGYNVMVSKISYDLSSLLASTFLGSGLGRAVLIDSSDNIYLTGFTDGTDFPTTSNAYSESFGGGSRDAFFSVFNVDLDELISSTYLGGSSEDFGYCLAIDSSNNIFIVGATDSSDFPIIAGAYDSSQNGSFDFFIIKFFPINTTYQVNNGVPCDDSTIDSDITPYCTIGAALADVPWPVTLPYVINVHAGTYNESFTAADGSSATNTITIQANPGNCGAVVCDDVHLVGSPVFDALILQAYTIIDGLDITNSAGRCLRSEGHYNIIKNSTFHDCDDDCLLINGDNTQILNNTIENCGATGIQGYAAADNLTVDGNIIHDCAGDGAARQVATFSNNTIYNIDSTWAVSSTENSLIYGNTFYNCYGAIAANHDAQIFNNKVYDNQLGITIAGDDVSLSNNIIYNNDFGIFTWGGEGMEVTNNSIYNNSCSGAFVFSDNVANPAVISNNIIADNNTSACGTITNWWDTGFDFDFSGTDLGGLAFYEAGVVSTYSQSSYNLFYNNGPTGSENVVTVSASTGNPTDPGTDTITSYEYALDIDSLTIAGNTFDHTFIADPLFTNSAGTDGIMGYSAGTDYGADDDFTLQVTSPGVNGGDLASAYVNEPVPNGSRIDLGAYGNTAAATIIGSPTSQTGSATSSVNTAPALSILGVSGAVGSGDVTLTFTLADAESDICNVTPNNGWGVWYSTDQTTWHVATVTGDTGLISSPAGTSQTVIWQSAIDLPAYSGDYWLAIKANDGSLSSINWLTNNIYLRDATCTTNLASIILGDTICVYQSDNTYNTNPATAETTQVQITTTTGDTESLTLTETGIDTGIFTGLILTADSSTASLGDNIVQASDGDAFTATQVILPSVTSLDDFESYADTAAMNAAGWLDALGGMIPGTALSLGTGAPTGNYMDLQIDEPANTYGADIVKAGITPFDMTGQALNLKVYVDDKTALDSVGHHFSALGVTGSNLKGLNVFVGSGAGTNLSYYEVPATDLVSGGWADLSIPNASFAAVPFTGYGAADMTQINMIGFLPITGQETTVGDVELDLDLRADDISYSSGAGGFGYSNSLLASGASTPSSGCSDTAPVSPSTVSAQLVPLGNNNYSIKLNWGNYTGSMVNIHRNNYPDVNNDTVQATPLTTQLNTVSEYTDSENIQLGKTYTYIIKAANNCGAIDDPGKEVQIAVPVAGAPVINVILGVRIIR